MAEYVTNHSILHKGIKHPKLEKEKKSWRFAPVSEETSPGYIMLKNCNTQISSIILLCGVYTWQSSPTGTKRTSCDFFFFFVISDLIYLRSVKSFLTYLANLNVFINWTYVRYNYWIYEKVWYKVRKIKKFILEENR